MLPSAGVGRVRLAGRGVAMKYIAEYRSSELGRGLIGRINRRAGTPARFMEFCGGHTVAIFKFGLRQVLHESISMVSGPGCPVCVTANPDLDKAMAMARLPGVIVTTFGDMFKVPGSHGSLQEAKAEGCDVRMVYSPLDALTVAQENPRFQVVFLGIGFETTAPAVAASVVEARARGLDNFLVHSTHKVCPPPLRAILDSGETDLQGLICPGHVSAIIGSKAWEPIARDYGVPCVVAGFEPVDILQAVDMLSAQVEKGEARVEIAYRRSVRREGNIKAQALLARVFTPATANWRGLGDIPASGLRLSEEFSQFDADLVLDVDPGPSIEPKGCICGAVLRGILTPLDCPLFDVTCTPVNPVGPCMVSSEGSCAAYYRFGRGEPGAAT